jgi:hypothetical protein
VTSSFGAEGFDPALRFVFMEPSAPESFLMNARRERILVLLLFLAFVLVALGFEHRTGIVPFKHGSLLSKV